MTDKPERKDYPPYLDCPRPRVPMTNGDKIRAMTDEELADFLFKGSELGFPAWCFETIPEGDPCDMEFSCRTCGKNWLKQEAKQ